MRIFKTGKKGQITLFMIIGILMLLFVGIYAYLNFNGSSQGLNTNLANMQQAKAHFDSCVIETTASGLKELGEKGGYYDIPEAIKKNETSLWYLNQINVQPSLYQLKEKTEKYVDSNLEDCIDFDGLKKQGFDVSTNSPKTEIIFGVDRTTIIVNYTVELKKQGVYQKYDEFRQDLDVRFRKMFELSSQIINKELEPSFNFSDPLNGVNKFDFDISFKSLDNETIIYSIVDKTRMENAEYFGITFASQFGNSTLKRTVELQPNSNTNPTVLPFTIYSVDRMAELIIMPGTMFNLNSGPVQNISVQQTYPTEVSRDNVPMTETADDKIINQTISWNLTYPVYNFEPTGMRFNAGNPQRLLLFWDEARIPHKGEIGIIFSEDGTNWRPLQSKADYQNHFVYTDIPGFSSYSLVDCGVINERNIEVVAEAEGGGWSFIQILIIVVIAIIIIVATILTAGAGASLLAGFPAAQMTLVGTFTVGLNTLGTAGLVAAIGGGLAGGAYLAPDTTMGAGQDYITFTPACHQNLTITSEITEGKGSCTATEGTTKVSIKNGKESVMAVNPGVPITLQATIKKCKGGMFSSVTCTLKCKTTYL
jgi:hypothetical protein